MSETPVEPPATLPDLIAPGMRLVVVGINPSLYSVAVGHYYARPGNDFWKMLAETGLTSSVLAPSEDHELPRLGIGLTDLVKTPSNNFDELPSGVFAGALDDLRSRLAATDPAVVLFNGSGGLERSLRRRPGFGRLDPGIAIGAAAVLCMPSSSGAREASETWPWPSSGRQPHWPSRSGSLAARSRRPLQLGFQRTRSQ